VSNHVSGVFNRVKVFSATKVRDRADLGNRVTKFVREFLKEGGVIVDKVVTQSSDREFHCMSITLFLKKEK
jgi:hypothetical protein